EQAKIFVGALLERQSAGVEVRIAYHHGPSARAWAGGAVDVGEPSETASFLASTGLPVAPIGSGAGRPHLMHHKYLVIDAGAPGARVVTGSANITDSAFSIQENNLIAISSPELAAHYARNFDELWGTRDVRGSGLHVGGREIVHHASKPAPVEVRFAP